MIKYCEYDKYNIVNIHFLTWSLYSSNLFHYGICLFSMLTDSKQVDGQSDGLPLPIDIS